MTSPTAHGRRARSFPVLLTALALLAVALLVLGCSSSSSGGYGASATSATSATTPTTAAGGSTGTSTSAGGATAGPKVDISNFSFNPGTLTVKVGDTVTWTNNDSATHTVTANDNSFDSANLASGASFSHTFSKAGTYPYRCTIHPNMTGTIVVQ